MAKKYVWEWMANPHKLTIRGAREGRGSADSLEAASGAAERSLKAALEPDHGEIGFHLEDQDGERWTISAGSDEQGLLAYIVIAVAEVVHKRSPKWGRRRVVRPTPAQRAESYATYETEPEDEEKTRALVEMSEHLSRGIGKRQSHPWAEANPYALDNVWALIGRVALKIAQPIVMHLGIETWKRLLAMSVEERAVWLEAAGKKYSWLMGPMRLLYKGPFFKKAKRKARKKMFLALARALESPEVQQVAEATASATLEAAANPRRARRNPSKFGSRPAPGQAKGELWKRGYHELKFFKDDYELGRGPVSIYLGTKDSKRYYLRVARLARTDKIVVNADLLHAYPNPRAHENAPWDESMRSHASPCRRCGGVGKLDQFTHVEKGVCFKCGGGGAVERNWRSADPVEQFVFMGQPVRIYQVKGALHLLVREKDFQKLGQTKMLSVNNQGVPFWLNDGQVRAYGKGPGLSVPVSVIEETYPNYMYLQYGVGGSERRDRLTRQQAQELRRMHRSRVALGLRMLAALQAHYAGKK